MGTWKTKISLRTWMLVFLILAGCGQTQAQADKSLADARRGFATKLIRQEKIGEAAPTPPVKVLELISYPAPLGNMSAYISPAPHDGKKYPAIIWITGGFANRISDIAWTPCPPENDQSGSAFRQPGVILMYPSLRGGNNNPGYLEGFYGEVDDVLAAIAFLKKQDDVDPQRIYLGGHSTGGTLALLVAESTDQLRAVFAFGPIREINGYGAERLPFDIDDSRETALRSPGRWLAAIHTPTFVFEGTGQPSNIGELRLMALLNKNPLVKFYPVEGATHFSILAKETRFIAGKILGDTNSLAKISIGKEEPNKAFSQ